MERRGDGRMTIVEMRTALQEKGDPSLELYVKNVIRDTTYPMLCVRMEPLRRIAKTAAKGDWRALIAGPFDYYEEVLCTALAATYAKASLRERLMGLRRLLPYMDSWGMTDSVVTTIRFLETERPVLWDFALECLEGKGEYTVRFGVVLILRFFLTEEEIPQVAQRLCAIRDERYYVQMAISWAFAEMAVTNYEIVEKILESGEISPFIHNKTIQKMRESYRISAEKKEKAGLLRRK